MCGNFGEVVYDHRTPQGPASGHYVAPFSSYSLFEHGYNCFNIYYKLIKNYTLKLQSSCDSGGIARIYRPITGPLCFGWSVPMRWTYRPLLDFVQSVVEVHCDFVTLGYHSEPRRWRFEAFPGCNVLTLLSSSKKWVVKFLGPIDDEIGNN